MYAFLLSFFLSSLLLVSQCIGITFKNKIVCAVVFIFTHFSCYTHTHSHLHTHTKSQIKPLSIYPSISCFTLNMKTGGLVEWLKFLGRQYGYTLYWNAKKLGKRQAEKSSNEAIFLLRIATHHFHNHHHLHHYYHHREQVVNFPT